MSRRRIGSCVLILTVCGLAQTDKGSSNVLQGRIPVLLDATKSPPFPVMETSAELLYLLKEYDSKDVFGFKDELERSDALQWLFFWHGSGGI